MRHFIRSVKYFVALVVIFFAVSFLMNFAGGLPLTFAQRMELFMADSGALKIVMLVVLAGLYPLFGFVKRSVEGDITKHQGQIIVAMERAGFTLRSQGEGKMVFGANTIFRRLTFLFEDKITVTQRGEQIEIEGVRRGVVYVVYYADAYIKNSERAERGEEQEK